MRRLIIGIFGVIIFGVGIYLVTSILPFLFLSKERIMNQANCKDEELAMEDRIDGVLNRKYRDEENHMWKTIEYLDPSGTYRSIILQNDRSGAFDFVMPADSIFKNPSSLEFIVARGGMKTRFQLDYGCIKKK